MSRQTLCLNMIVKNESLIIERLIKSVLPLIDTYCICDTGSSDNTMAIIRDTMESAGISGEVFEEPFQNFGYNRTVALERASRWGDFALLLDADMKLVIEPAFNKQEILHKADVIAIQQKNSYITYYNTRIVRTGRGVKCVGPTHEYYDVPSGLNKLNIDSLWIQDIGDGGCKADKFHRDIRLLSEALEIEPRNGRYLFYLANSYRDIGEWHQAIKQYKKRIDVGGWVEEIFMACYFIGNCYEKIEDYPNACYWWLEGYNRHPCRAESLYALCRFYRIHRKYNLALQIWDIGRKIPYPKDDVLFIDHGVYSNGFLYEFSIIACYLKLPIQHREYMRLFETGYRNSAISNYKFYAMKLKDLPGATEIDFTDISDKVLHGRQDTFRSSSPCLIPSAAKDGNYIMNVRYVNYKISPSGCYEFRHNDGKITTLNRTLWLDYNFNVRKEHWFNDVTNPHLRYQGVEDVRIFEHNNELHFVGVVEHPTKSVITVGYGCYDTNVSLLKPSVFESPLGRTCEKNWVYFHDSSGALRMIYDWHPLTILAPDGTIQHSITSVPDFFHILRGSTCGVPVGDELWFVCHFVEYSTPRHYYHIIVALDRDATAVRRTSIPFKFHADPIEYCLGLVVEDERVLFSYSRWDCSSAVIVLPRNEFIDLYFSGC